MDERRPPGGRLAAPVRDLEPDRHEDRRLMRATLSRRPASRPVRIGLGALVVLAYLCSALLSSRLSPLARHPLLDGTGTALPYRYVSPPPNLASSNQQPAGVTKTVKLSQAGGSGYVFTPDGQAAVIMGNRTFKDIPGAQGQTGVLMKIEPLNPATLGTLPTGKQASGNAYRVTATIQPSGTPITQFGAAVTITLIYPPVASAGVTPPPRTIMWSKDGSSWTPLPTQDSHAGLQAATSTRRNGYFVVATPPLPAASTTTSHVRLLAIVVLIALAVFVVAGALYIVRTRRREKAGA
jgi:hypothetical protein